MRKFGWGATSLALLSAAAMVGCSKSKGSTIITLGGGGGDINDGSSTSFGAISLNNLSQDGAGFSHNGQTIGEGSVRVVFNEGQVGNVSSSGGGANVQFGDGSAIVAFITNDSTNSSTNTSYSGERLYLSHFDGNGFTPPVEVTGENRDESLTGQISLQNMVICPLNTKNYGTTTTTQGGARDNDGNWVIVWDATTAFKDPRLNQRRSADVAAALNGPHRTLYYTLFQKSLRTKSTALSGAIGRVGTTAGTDREYRYGFLHRAIDITNLGGGEAPLDQGTSATPFVSSGTARFSRPAEDVIGYGFASDTIRGGAGFNSYSGSGTSQSAEPRPIETFYGTSLDASLKAREVLGTNSRTGTVGSAGLSGTARPAASGYKVGDATTFLRVFYTQIVSSGRGSQSAYSSPSGANAEHAGQRYAMFSTGFNLATQAFDATTAGSLANEIPMPAKRTNPGVWGTQPLPGIGVYNQHVFIRYVDGSLKNQSVANGAGQTEAENASQAMGVLTVKDNGDGTCKLDTTVSHDVTLLGASGKHNITLRNKINNSNPNPQDGKGGDEFVDFVFARKDGGIDWFVGGFNGSQVYGADEGLTDTTFFAIVHCDSLGTGNSFNNATTEEVRLIAHAVKADGTIVTGAPKILSAHENQLTRLTAQPAGTSAAKLQSLNQSACDSVIDFDSKISRDGTYVMLAFRQFGGTTMGARIVLNAICYRTERQGSTVAFDTARFSATKQLSNTSIAQTETVRGDSTTGGVNGLAGAEGVQAGDRTFFQPAENTSRVNFVLLRNRGNASGDLRMNTAYGDYTTPGCLTNAPVTQFRFQDGLGYATGFQSDVKVMNIFWAVQDGTNDRLWASQIKTDLTGTGAPTISAATEIELEASSSITGPALANWGQNNANNPSILKTTYNFIPWSLNLNGQLIGGSTKNRFVAHDAGLDSAGVGGACLVSFVKIQDGSTNDNDFFDAGIVSILFTGSAASDRAQIERGVQENTQTSVGNTLGLAAATDGGFNQQSEAVEVDQQLSQFKTSEIWQVATEKNGDAGTKPSFGPKSIFLVFTAPQVGANNGQGAKHLFARIFSAESRSDSTKASLAFVDRYSPSASTSVTATYPEPSQLNRNLGSNARFSGARTKAGKVSVFLLQDNHGYEAIYNNGKWSQDSNGMPYPGLLDNNHSGTLESMNLASPRDTNGDDLGKTLCALMKNDYTGAGGTKDVRVYYRIGQ